MNLGDLDDELKLLLGNRSDTAITAARRYLWLNNAQKELAYAFPFFQNADKVSTSMVIGQSEYALPENCVAIYSIRDVTLKRKIARSSFRKFDNIDALQSGNPTHYCRFGNWFELTPVPSAANTMLLRFGKEIVSMSNRVDNPTLPDPWHEVVLLGAEVRGWRALRQLDQMAIVKNEYLQLLRSREPEWEQEEADEEWGVEVVR
jgi:hypothetical protein